MQLKHTVEHGGFMVYVRLIAATWQPDHTFGQDNGPYTGWVGLYHNGEPLFAFQRNHKKFMASLPIHTSFTEHELSHCAYLDGGQIYKLFEQVSKSIPKVPTSGEFPIELPDVGLVLSGKEGDELLITGNAGKPPVKVGAWDFQAVWTELVNWYLHTLRVHVEAPQREVFHQLEETFNAVRAGL